MSAQLLHHLSGSIVMQNRLVDQRRKGAREAVNLAWTRSCVAFVSFVCSACVGAATIQTVVNDKPPMCAQLQKMIEAAGVPQMTDAQLCDFRFARLPRSMTFGFTFPHWQEIAVADAPSMYLRMLVANRAPRSAAPPLDLSWARDRATQAALDHNLAFYRTTLPLDGRNVTFVAMDIMRCSKLPYMRDLGFPYYATYDQPDFREPEPSFTITDGVQIALWGKTTPVRLEIFNHWETGGGTAPAVVVMLENLDRFPAQGRRDAILNGATTCSFYIENKDKEKEKAP
jgi:uncharacterized membrane protein YidH (DUF202 family)